MLRNVSQCKWANNVEIIIFRLEKCTQFVLVDARNALCANAHIIRRSTTLLYAILFGFGFN